MGQKSNCNGWLRLSEGVGKLVGNRRLVKIPQFFSVKDSQKRRRSREQTRVQYSRRSQQRLDDEQSRRQLSGADWATGLLLFDKPTATIWPCFVLFHFVYISLVFSLNCATIFVTINPIANNKSSKIWFILLIQLLLKLG